MKLKWMLSLMLIVGAGAAMAQPEVFAARHQATAMYRIADGAINRGDFKTFFMMFAPDFHAVDLQGKKSNFGQFKAGIGKQLKTMRDIHIHTRVWNVQLQNKEIAVWVQEELSWKQMTKGRWVPMTYTSRYCDTIRRDGDRWFYTYSQALPMDETWSFKTNH